MLPRDFINHNELRIFDAAKTPPFVKRSKRQSHPAVRKAQRAEERQPEDGTVNVAPRNQKMLIGKHRIG